MSNPVREWHKVDAQTIRLERLCRARAYGGKPHALEVAHIAP